MKPTTVRLMLMCISASMIFIIAGCVNTAVTRAELAEIALRYKNIVAGSTAPSFNDTKNHWASHIINI